METLEMKQESAVPTRYSKLRDGKRRGRLPDTRERLARYGASGLSDCELVAAILGTGVAGKPVMRLAEEVVTVIDSPVATVGDVREAGNPREGIFSGIKGLGVAKSATMEAALELGRRLHACTRKRIREPGDAWSVVLRWAERPQEHFVSLTLNGAHELIQARVITIGLVNRTIVHPREVFADAIRDRATAIIVAHNHPSGSLDPSKEDIDLTKRLENSAELLGIDLLDHLVFSLDGFVSFAEKGLMSP